jgi:hypothetical protein
MRPPQLQRRASLSASTFLFLNVVLFGPSVFCGKGETGGAWNLATLQLRAAEHVIDVRKAKVMELRAGVALGSPAHFVTRSEPTAVEEMQEVRRGADIADTDLNKGCLDCVPLKQHASHQEKELVLAAGLIAQLKSQREAALNLLEAFLTLSIQDQTTEAKSLVTEDLGSDMLTRRGTYTYYGEADDCTGCKEEDLSFVSSSEVLTPEPYPAHGCGETLVDLNVIDPTTDVDLYMIDDTTEALAGHRQMNTHVPLPYSTNGDSLLESCLEHLSHGSLLAYDPLPTQRVWL